MRSYDDRKIELTRFGKIFQLVDPLPADVELKETWMGLRFLQKLVHSGSDRLDLVVHLPVEQHVGLRVQHARVFDLGEIGKINYNLLL
jgi:hypothetical protein